MGDKISVTVIATGFNSPDSCEEEKPFEEENPVPEPKKEDSNNYSLDEFNSILNPGYSEKPQTGEFDFEENSKVPVSSYASSKENSERTDWRARIGSGDPNDLSTPAAMRKSSGYSRTINFNRKK